MEERRRVLLPRHWIGKMSCDGRLSTMERVKEAGTPNLVGQGPWARLGNARYRCSKQSPMCYEEEPLPPRWSASRRRTGQIRVRTTSPRSLAAPCAGKSSPKAPIDTGRDGMVSKGLCYRCNSAIGFARKRSASVYRQCPAPRPFTGTVASIAFN